MMMTLEETKILQYLGRHHSATASDLSRSCLAGAPPEWVSRVIANLDYLGYVTVFANLGGDAVLLITAKGLAQSGARV